MAQAISTERQRIVSLAAGGTSILVALGARRELIGMTKWHPNVAQDEGGHTEPATKSGPHDDPEARDRPAGRRNGK